MKASDVVTALPHAFYPESSWRDDMEWAAAELALAGQALATPAPTTGSCMAPDGRLRISMKRPAATP